MIVSYDESASVRFVAADELHAAAKALSPVAKEVLKETPESVPKALESDVVSDGDEQLKGQPKEKK